MATYQVVGFGSRQTHPFPEKEREQCTVRNCACRHVQRPHHAIDDGRNLAWYFMPKLFVPTSRMINLGCSPLKLAIFQPCNVIYVSCSNLVEDITGQ